MSELFKTFHSDVEIKSGDQGTFSAVVASLGVIDHDNDVLLPGSIRDGAKVIVSSFNHSAFGSSLPVGKGVMRSTKTEAIVDGRFFLDTTAGREAFTVLKELGDSEFSIGYRIRQAERGKFDGRDVQFLKALDVFEVSMVAVGAGIRTRLLDLKASKSHRSDAEIVDDVLRHTVHSIRDRFEAHERAELEEIRRDLLHSRLKSADQDEMQFISRRWLSDLRSDDRRAA